MSITNFENKLLNVIKEQRLLQWENYACDKNHDLNKVNKKIYNLITEKSYEDIFNDRKKEIYDRLYTKYIIENELNIARLRNKLDNRSNYNSNLDKNHSNYKVKLAKQMRDDVVQLIKLRNKKAKNMGFTSYPDLIFYTEELNRDSVKNQIENYLNKNIEKASSLINKYNLTWQNWFDRLRSIGTFKSNNYQTYIDCLLSRLGFDSLKESIEFYFKEQPISGIAFGISIPDDIKILLKPVTSLMKSKVLFHECGHGINYASNKEKGLYTLYTTSCDEIIATVFETIGIKICMNKKERQITEEIKFLESIRCSISHLFEMELWGNTDRAENLFREYQQILPMKPENKSLWTLDTFRYIDPVYNHNYVLGELYSQDIVNKLEAVFGDNYKEWGRVIYRYFLKEGRKRAFENKYQKFVDDFKAGI